MPESRLINLIVGFIIICVVLYILCPFLEQIVDKVMNARMGHLHIH